jgi:hypothetical protein
MIKNNKFFDKLFYKFTKTYYYSALLFPKDVREDVAVLYAFVRIPDEYVDNPVTDPEESLMSFWGEFDKAWKNGGSDALCDLTYVAVGNLCMLHGLKDKFQDAFAEVQASNMSKACKTEEEAIETCKKEQERIGEPTHYEPHGNYFIVYRTRDRKVLKSINYFKPNLAQFFTEKELGNV